jgi:hypothetical protein
MAAPAFQDSLPAPLTTLTRTPKIVQTRRRHSEPFDFRRAHHRALNFAGATQRIDHTGEFRQRPVAGRLNDPVVMLGEFRIEELVTQRLEVFERAFLVRPHQPRITGDIGGEDRGETASCSHSSGSPALRRPSRYMASTSGEANLAQIYFYAGLVWCAGRQ